MVPTFKLFVLVFKKLKRVFASIEFQNNGQFCYLRLFLGIKTVSCRLLLRKANGLNLEKVGSFFHNF